MPVETEGIEAFVGKRVHEVLERLYQFAARGLVPSLARVIARFRSNWEEQYDAARLRIVRAEMTPGDYRRGGERCLENAYRRLYPFDDETLGLEREIQFPLDSEGRYAVARRDRPAGARPRRRPRDPRLQDRAPRAVPGGARPATASSPSTRSACARRFAKRARCASSGTTSSPNVMRTSQRTPEQLAALREETRGVIDRIRAETAWEPRPGPLCRWCEYQSVCPVFAGAAAAKVAELPAPDVEPDEGELGQLSLW